MKSVSLMLIVFVVALIAFTAFTATGRAAAQDVGYRVAQALFGYMHRSGLILGAYNFPEGAKIFYSNTFASAKTASAATNANPTVVTSVAHGYSDNDELLVTNAGWEDATDTVWKADQLSADTLSLLGLDTTNTNFYAAGGFANALMQKISSWVEIPQVLTIQTQGGDPRFTQVSPLGRRNSFNIPTGFNPTSMTLSLGHDPANATYQAMLAISRALSPVAIKLVLGGGAKTYGYGYMATSEVPSLNVNQVNSVACAFALQGRSISYAS